MSKSKKPENADRTLSLSLYLFFGLAVIGTGFLYRSSLITGLYSLEATISEMDYWGPLLMTLVATVWAILCLPGPIVLGFIGTVFSSHPFIGLAIALAADSIASAFGFLVTRHLGRDRIKRWLEKKPWFQWLEEQAELRGIYGVFVIRMMPFFPNSLASYAFGLAKLRFWPYLISSILGSIPNLAVYVFGSAGAVHLIREGLGADTLYFALSVLLGTAGVLLLLQGVLRRHGRLAPWQPEPQAEAPADRVQDSPTEAP